jgi:hypothetical protein
LRRRWRYPRLGFDSEPPTRQVKVLAINNVYRIDGVDEVASCGIARVRSPRRELGAELVIALTLEGRI